MGRPTRAACGEEEGVQIHQRRGPGRWAGPRACVPVTGAPFVVPSGPTRVWRNRPTSSQAISLTGVRVWPVLSQHNVRRMRKDVAKPDSVRGQGSHQPLAGSATE